MDRSVDSIGSCSLDVDADSTDFSDTSGSLNLATPSSAKDITKEFTLKIKERCQIPQINCQQTTTLLDPCSGKINTVITTIESPDNSPAKKPSYLNLACCVNGYSNLTTYDSKLRQNINKSREVSPIRPSASSLQYCKALGNLLAPPVPMPVSQKSPSKERIMESRNFSQDKTIFAQTKEHSIDTTDNVGNATYYKTSKFMSSAIITSSDFQQSETKTKSFIQQRVERLYGPGALAQGFYSPKKSRTYDGSVLCERSNNTQNQYLGPHNELSNKTLPNMRDVEEDFENLKNCADLPVLRHLRPEFRAQLPISSPKKSQSKISTEANPIQNGFNAQHLNGIDKTGVIKHVDKAISVDPRNDSNCENFANTVISEAVKSIEDIEISSQKVEVGDFTITKNLIKIEEPSDSLEQRDGNYFLRLLKTEQNRLLNLAAKADKDMEILLCTEVSEEIIGYIRSASGKARLLASQKMKQFEGLCKNNLNRSPEEKFPTTNEDLQGFWDMVKLQIENVDCLFAEIELMRTNNWEKSEHTLPPPSGSKLTKRINNSKPSTSGTTKPTTAKGPSPKNTSLAAQKREAQRKQLMELKRKHKMAISADQQQQNSNSIEIFVNENCS